jgi:hypothetical protein
MNDELPTLDPELALLYGAEKSDPVAIDDATQARILAAVSAKVAGEAALTVTAASTLTGGKVALIALAAFVGGGGAGAVMYAELGPVRIVERRVEVTREVPIEEDAAAPPPDAAVATDAGVPETARARRPEPEAPRSVAAEQRLLDAARAAKARGATVDALAALRRHRERFEHGQLAQERDVLRIEILVASGQHERARAEMAAFETSYPHSVHRARLERLLARMPQ